MPEYPLSVVARNPRAAGAQRARRGTAVVSGFCHPAFRSIEDTLRRELRNHPGGVAVSIYLRGECVGDLWGGAKDGRGNTWQRDTMAPSFSTTKGVCSTLLHICADRGLVGYDQPVATYWPEFAQAGKGAITVRQVLSHQAGLYHIRRMIDDAGRMLDWPHMVRAIEKARPVYTPGTRTAYHALTYGFIVGEIIQRVTGRSFPELLRTELAEPLGLDGLFIGAPAEELHRAAELIKGPPARRIAQYTLGQLLQQQVHITDRVLKTLGIDSQLSSFHDALVPRGMRRFNLGSAKTLGEPIPAGNGLFTARSLARMYAMIAGGGEIDGVRLLSEDTIDRLSRTEPAPGRHAVVPVDLRWRLGYHGVYSRRGFEPGAFGHFGVGGSGAWALPDLELAFALVTNGGARSPLMRLSGEVVDRARRLVSA